MRILVINGPNINMLGIREPEIYGKKSYDDILSFIKDSTMKFNVDLEFFQSNHEGDLIDKIQLAYNNFDGIVINPAAYTHSSIALLDAVKAVGIPTVEVHISDPDKRENFRKISYIRQGCVKTIKGKGIVGYIEAVEYLVKHHS